MIKHLDAKGKGVLDYDYKEDTLFFKIKDREYEKSIDFEDVVIDIDKEGYITGIQIFDASKLFKLAKESLREIKHFEFEAKVENNVISISVFFQYLRRNKQIVERAQNLIRESVSPLQESQTVCTVPT